MEKTQRKGSAAIYLLGDKLMLDVDALQILALPPTDVKLSVYLGLTPPSEHLFFKPHFDGIPSISKNCSKNGRAKCAIDPFHYKNLTDFSSNFRMHGTGLILDCGNIEKNEIIWISIHLR